MSSVLRYLAKRASNERKIKLTICLVVCMTDEAEWEILVREPLELPFESHSSIRYFFHSMQFSSIFVFALKGKRSSAGNWNREPYVRAGDDPSYEKHALLTKTITWHAIYYNMATRYAYVVHNYSNFPTNHELYMRQNDEKTKKNPQSISVLSHALDYK